MSGKNSKKSTPISTRSKPSTVSDTATRKVRRLPLRAGKGDLPELDQLLDLYWGGPERRITGITLRIIAVNAVALLMLLIGFLYLGQYQQNLIEDKLQNFKSEVDLTSIALSESALVIHPESGEYILDLDQARRTGLRLSAVTGKKMILFDRSGNKVAATEITKVMPKGGALKTPEDEFHTVTILKKTAGFFLKIFPQSKTLPPYPATISNDATDYPDARQAVKGQISMSAWLDRGHGVLLSAAAPLQKDGKMAGIVLLTREGDDIEQDVSDVWFNIVLAFVATLVLTVLLSIYLSGVIAGPLRTLANAAEGVRKGKLSYADIPDFSDRNDEIGELSIALRQMTKALWDRMDSIETFAADVSHELKNPLSSLRSAIETAAVVKKKKDREKLMAIVQDDVERLDRLITDISNASRLDSELSREEVRRVNIKHLLKNILEIYKSPLEREKASITSWPDRTESENAAILLSSESDENIYVWGTEGRLAQVFQNLLANAVSFSPSGGLIKMNIRPQNQKVFITVEDQGPGIPENKRQNIFERFYSQRPDHEDYGKHSGLGLAICKQIVEALGGEIYVDNIKDGKGAVKGAQFTVVLNRA